MSQTSKKSSKKKHPLIIFLLFILVAAVSAGATYLYITSRDNKEPEEKTESTTTATTNDKTEKVVTDTVLKNYLISRVALLHGTEAGDIKDDTIATIPMAIVYDLYTNQLTNSEEIGVTALSLKSSFVALDPYDAGDAALGVAIYNANPTWYYNGLSEVYVNTKKLSAGRLIAEGATIFGETLTKESSNGTCSLFVYNEEYDMFYTGIDGCGGSGMWHHFYIDRVTTKNSKAYVYVNASSSIVSETGSCNTYIDVISQPDENLKYGTCGEEAGQSPVNSDNHSIFKEYRFTFQKNDDGDYFFTGVKKL